MTNVPITVDVNLEDRSYPIFIGSNILPSFDVWGISNASERSAFIIYDARLNDPYHNNLSSILSRHHSRVESFAVPSGESSKSFPQFESSINWLLEKNVNRRSVIYALGGGVIGDLAGFVAASILRGIDFIQIPTTLLACVDSSVGGKTGINTAHGKNLVGAFYQPKKVLIDVTTLNTLPLREHRAGYAEIIKYALLGDGEFFDWLEVHGSKILDGDIQSAVYAIEKSCHMKAQIIQKDEREKLGLRALLNLGHTFAHALEAAAQYDGRLLHGEAVSIGLVLAARLSESLNFISSQHVARIESHLKSCGMMTEISQITPRISMSSDDLAAMMKNDKKSVYDGIQFIVLKSIGHAATHKISDMSIIKNILTESLNHGT